MDGLTDRLDLASIVGVEMGQTRHHPLWSSRIPRFQHCPSSSSGRYEVILSSGTPESPQALL